MPLDAPVMITTFLRKIGLGKFILLRVFKIEREIQDSDLFHGNFYLVAGWFLYGFLAETCF